MFANLELSDINGDGRLDILTAFSSRVDHESNDWGGVIWFAGLDDGFDGNVRKLSTGELEIPSETGIPAFVGSADLDSDGDDDVVSVWLEDRVNTAEGLRIDPAYVRVDQARSDSFAGRR